MTNSNKYVFIDRNTSHIKHGWQAKRMIMEYNACVSCALIGHNFPTVLQTHLERLDIHVFLNNYHGSIARPKSDNICGKPTCMYLSSIKSS